MSKRNTAKRAATSTVHETLTTQMVNRWLRARRKVILAVANMIGRVVRVSRGVFTVRDATGQLTFVRLSSRVVVHQSSALGVIIAPARYV